MSALHKKALVVRNLMRLILFVIVLAFIILPMVIRIYNIFYGTHVVTATTNSMMMMTKQIKYMDTEITIPVTVDDKHMIMAFNYDSEKPAKCKSEYSCLCVCDVDECLAKVIQCEKIEYEIDSTKLKFKEGFQVLPTNGIKNFKISKTDDVLSIEQYFDT